MDKTRTGLYALKNIISLCLVFGACLCFAPSAGVLRTIPFVFLSAVASGALNAKIKYCAPFAFVMTMCLYLAAARSVGEALGFSAAAMVFTLFGMFFSRLLILCFKTQKEKVKQRAALLSAIFVIAALVLSLLLTGNTFGYSKHNKANREYVQKSYGDLASVNYTFFHPLCAEYRTYVTFSDVVKMDGKDTEIFYGEDDSVYVARKDGKLYDDVKNYFEERIKVNAEHDLESIILGASYGFKVVKSDIDFPDNELVDMSKNYTEYLDRVSYVVTFDSVVSKGQRERFVSVCAEALGKLKQAAENDAFAYDTIVFCAGDAHDVVYSMTADMTTAAENAEELVSDYHESHTKAYGVTIEHILSYWQNN